MYRENEMNEENNAISRRRRRRRRRRIKRGKKRCALSMVKKGNWAEKERVCV
jgi:hypothetical protein